MESWWATINLHMETFFQQWLAIFADLKNSCVLKEQPLNPVDHLCPDGIFEGKHLVCIYHELMDAHVCYR